MQRISKGNPPAFFSDFIKKEKPKDWNDVAPIREKLREYILENEQKGFCAYTEIKIRYKAAGTAISIISIPAICFQLRLSRTIICWCPAIPKNMGPNTKTSKSEAKRITIFSLIRQLTLLLSIWNIPLQGRWKLLGLVNRRKKAIINLNSMKDALTEDELVAAIGEFETMIRQLYRQG